MPSRGPDFGVLVPRKIRTHRLPDSTIWETLFVLIGMLVCCGALGVVSAIRVVLLGVAHALGPVPALTVVLVLATAVPAAGRRWRLARRRAVIRWGAGSGWEPVVGRRAWPWTRPPFEADKVTVEFAIRAEVDGYPVTIGEVSWERDGFEGVAHETAGRGIVAVARLSRAYPAASVRLRRGSADQRFEAPFDRRWRVLLEDVEMVDRVATPELMAAHAAEQLPPWMITGNEIFALLATGRALRPPTVVELAGQLLRLLRLLELPPPGSGN